jgi:hypothetical protein
MPGPRGKEPSSSAPKKRLIQFKLKEPDVQLFDALVEQEFGEEVYGGRVALLRKMIHQWSADRQDNGQKKR